MPSKLSDADAIALAVAGVPMEPPGRTNSDAMHDHGLPILVRGFLSAHCGSATLINLRQQAGLVPRLYGTWQPPQDGSWGNDPIRVRVVMVSTMGDIGISRKDQETGYFTRCSIYDLTDFADEMHPAAPAERKATRFFTFVSKEGYWVHRSTDGKLHACKRPVLFDDRSGANKVLHKTDPYGLTGTRVIPVDLAPVQE